MPQEVRSELQLQLESRGYEFLTNVNPMIETGIPQRADPKTGMLYFDRVLRMYPATDTEIANRYSHFENILVTDAYDIHGNPIPDFRAVYVRRQQK
ncbi:MAG: hypothetical protein HYT70_01305 [Candidatus Aenigmarchaeota archaeon]|nr:hypothetical protein [Candidatus Aenigmarchaeota archaeon]